MDVLHYKEKTGEGSGVKNDIINGGDKMVDIKKGYKEWKKRAPRYKTGEVIIPEAYGKTPLTSAVHSIKLKKPNIDG